MTREELIDEMNWEEKWLADVGYNAYNVSLSFESIKYKIKALGQEPCEDAVSRQAVIAIIKDWWEKGVIALDDIRELPSVTPTRKKGKWIAVKTRFLTKRELKELEDEAFGFSIEINDWIYDCKLPQDGQEVLITTDKGRVELTTFNNNHFEHWEDKGEVIAWSPLPRPYEEEMEIEE